MNIKDQYIHGADGKGVVKSLYFATGVESVSKLDGSANYNTAAAKDLVFLLADINGTKIGLPIPTLNLNTTGYAAKVLTQSRATNASHYLVFVDSNNSSATAESLYTDAGISYNPSTNTLALTKVTVSAAAGFNYTGIENATTDAARNIWFANASGRGIPCYNDNFTFNPAFNNNAGKLFVNNIEGTNIKITIGNTPVPLGGTYTPDTSISSSSTNNTIPSSLAVYNAILNGIATNDAMIFKGVINGGSTAATTAYTPAADKGHTYKVATAGYINGEYYQVNDTFICTEDNTAAATASNVDTIKANWGVVEGNGDYLNIHGGTMYGTLSWDSTTALPTVTTASSILVVDSNITKQISLANLRTIIGVNAYVASAASGTNGKKQITANLSDPYYNLVYGDTIVRSIQFKHGDDLSISASTGGVITYSLPVRLKALITSDTGTTIFNGFGRITSGGPFESFHTSAKDCMIVSTGYSSAWGGQLALDYRTSNIAYRAYNDGTWTDWALMASNRNVVNDNITVSWNTETTIATIAGIPIKIKIPSNPNVDTKVTLNKDTANTNYRILFKYTANDTNETTTVKYASTLFYNPSTKLFRNDGGGLFGGDVIMATENAFVGYQPRKKEDGGGWAYLPFRVKDYSNTIFTSLGVCGNGNDLLYIFIGANAYNSTANLQISPTGYTTAVGYIKVGSSDDYVLIGAGGHKQWSASSVASTIVARDANLYIFATYFNSNISDQNDLTIGSVYVRNNSDNYIRRMALSTFKTKLDGRWVLKTGDSMSGRLNITLDLATSEAKTSPVSQQLVLNGPPKPSNGWTAEQLANMKLYPGIGFHMPNVTYASLIFTGEFRFINSTYDGYANTRAAKFITNGGTSAQFVKGDGSLDSNTYALSSALLNYLPLSGGTMTGAIKRYYSAASDDPMIAMTANNQDTWLWRINHGTAVSTATSAVSGFGLKYLGTGNGINNSLVLYADNLNSTQVAAVTINQSGLITLANGNIVNNNITVPLNTEKTIATICGIPIKLKVTGTNNVITSAVVASSASGTSQITAALTNPYYNLLEGGSVTRSIRFLAGRGMTVTAATDGQITFKNNGLIKVTVANNVANDFNTFEDMTLTGRGDPATGASVVNAPWSNAGPAGGYGVLTYLWSGYGTQMAWGYNSNDIYIRKKWYNGSSTIWDTTWDKIAHSGNIANNNISVSWNTETTIATIAGVAIKIKIPSNPNVDTKVTQSKVTTSANYRLLFKYTNNDTDETTSVRYASTLYYNPSTKVLYNGGPITVGDGSFNDLTKIFGTVSASTLQSSYNLANSYTTETFLQAWCRYVQTNYSGKAIISHISPNSLGHVHAHVYNSGFVSLANIDSGGSYTGAELGAPIHVNGLYYDHGGNMRIFGYSYGKWYFYNNLHSGNSYVSGGGNTWGSSITVTLGGTSATLTIPLLSSLTYLIFNGSLNLKSTEWTTVAAITSYDTGTYAIQITSGTTLYASGIFSWCKATDTVSDEILLHVSGTTTAWRPYARINGNNLLMSSTDANLTSRSCTIKIFKLI